MLHRSPLRKRGQDTGIFLQSEWRERVKETLKVTILQPALQQLLCMCFLHVASQVVLAPKSLGTKLAEEVLAACVNHHVTPHIFAGVEIAFTMVTLMFLFLGAAAWLPCVSFEVF